MNAPIVIAKSMGALSGIFMMITSMVMGVPVLRDYQYNIESFMFVNPITKGDYLLGPFFGILCSVTFCLWGDANWFCV